MATREQIESLKISENVFELAEDAELEYLIHFAAPFTGSDKIMIPKGTAFAPSGPMNSESLYMNLVDSKGNGKDLFNAMAEQVQAHYSDLYDRLQGFSFFITEEQLQTLSLKFQSGSAERLLEIIRKLRSPLYPMFG